MAEQIRKEHQTPAPAEQVIDEMPETTPADLVEVDDVLAEIDEVLVDAAELGDDVLLDAARNERVTKVKATSGRRSDLQSHQARAWTRGGSVD